MESGLLTDSDWAPLDGEVCRVTTLTPLRFAKGKPYASMQVESPLLTERSTAFVRHKLDYEHLAEAFRRRDSEPNTEVLILWTKRHLKYGGKVLGRLMPRMWVMLCRKYTYEWMTDEAYESVLTAPEYFEPLAQWKPNVMK